MGQDTEHGTIPRLREHGLGGEKEERGREGKMGSKLVHIWACITGGVGSLYYTKDP